LPATERSVIIQQAMEMMMMMMIMDVLCQCFATATLVLVCLFLIYLMRSTTTVVSVDVLSVLRDFLFGCKTTRTMKNTVDEETTSLPGPKGMFYFGYAPWLGDQPQQTLAKLYRRFGDLFEVKAGCRRFVVVSSITTAESLAKRYPEQLCGKPRTFTTSQMSIGAHNDMVQRWKRRRAYTNAGLKYIERYSVLDIINSEVGHLMNFFRECEGEYKDVRHDISFFVSRVIYRMSYGGEPDADAQESLKTIVHTLPDYTRTIGSFSPYDLFPALRHILAARFNKFIDFNRFLGGFCKEQKVKHLIDHQPSITDDSYSQSPPSDLFEHFRRRWDRMSDVDKVKYNLTEDTLYDGLEDIIRAGTESSSLIIQWFLLYVSAFPRVQQTMQAELDAYMAKKVNKALPDEDDLPSLPYCQAVLSETYRYACLNPFLKRELTGNITHDGRLLRAGTVLLYNQWAINNDVRFFPNPREFKPERFLDAEGNYDDTLTHKFMPFGFGKRRCIGVYTGKTICLLAALSVVFKFHIQLDEGQKVDLEPVVGIGLSPKKYKVKVSAR